jgi:hypothetical protein
MAANKEVQHIPFSVLNELINNKLKDTDIYTAEKFSYLKVFEHALTYAALKNNKKLIRHRMHWPTGVYSLWSWIKCMVRSDGLKSPQLNRLVLIDPVRLNQDKDGGFYSIYLDKWIRLIAASDRTIIQRRKDNRVFADYSMDQFQRTHGAFDAVERDVLKELKLVRQKADKSGVFTAYELEHIGSTLAIFWEDFRFYYQLFKNSKTELVLFICHYHNEGMLAACKLLRIKSVELQHGLIARNDLYYVYHEQFKPIMRKALFPDTLFVYGPYWRNIVLEGSEFEPDQVIVAGDYLQRTTQNANHFLAKQQVIVVCAQKLMHKEYFYYCQRLKQCLMDYPEWRVIVKLHPLEPKKELYKEVLGNDFELVDMERTLDELLAIAKIQISIYSTTFFDAIGYDVVNFSIQNLGSSSDYAADIVKEAVAFPLGIDENPIKRFLEMSAYHVPMERTEIYAPFDPKLTSPILGLS